MSACSWSNSLYQARVASSEALTAEREDKPGDAENAWGRAAVKAESAYVRSPDGRQAAEALWLQGRALSRGRDCVRASAALERSALLRRDAPWRDNLTYALARCRDALQDRGALALYEQLASSRDTALSREAKRRAGEALVREGEWTEALRLLQQLDEPSARLNRAVALAALDRADEALTEVRPVVMLPDTVFDFVPLLEKLAGRNSARTNELLGTLATVASASPERRSRWLLAAARGAVRHDPAAADARLAQLAMLPPGPAVSAGALLAIDRLVALSLSPSDLRLRVDSLARMDTEGLSRLRAGELRRKSVSLLEEEASATPATPRGDLVLFVLAETARDSLAAPQLAGWLFGRIERDWPQSPYVAKSLLARLALFPDSGDALRARLSALASNPYLAYLRGEQDGAFVHLEDSLRTFVLERARAATGRRQVTTGDALPQ